MRSPWFALALTLMPLSAWANEIPPGYQTPLIQIAGLGWTMSPRSGAGGAVAPTNQFIVYSGCLQPPNAPGSYSTSKAWYFNSVTGSSPTLASGVGNGSGTGDGTQAHPFNDPRAVWSQNGNTNWTGWTKTLAVYSSYFQGGLQHPDFGSSGSVTITPSGTVTVTAGATWSRVSDGVQFVTGGQTATSSPFTLTFFSQQGGTVSNTVSGPDSFVPLSGVTGTITSASGTVSGGVNYDDPVNGDVGHHRVWPGDTIYLNGSWPSNKVAISPTSGPNYSVNDAGATQFTWMTTDPAASQNAFVSALTGGDARGLILNNLTIGHLNSAAQTSFPSGEIGLGSAYMSVPTTSLKLYLAQQEWDYVNSVVGAHQILINGSNLDAIDNTQNELTADPTMSSLMSFNVNQSMFQISWSGGSVTSGSKDFEPNLVFAAHATNVAAGTTFVVGTDTWTFVSGSPGALQIQIGTSLNGGAGSTFANIQTALSAAHPGISITLTQPTGVQATSLIAGFPGSYQMRLVGAVGVSASVVKLTATMPVLKTSNNALLDRAIILSGSHFKPTQDVIFANLNIGSTNYGNAFPGPTVDDYPQTGSAGVDVNTGLTSTVGTGGLSWFTNTTPLPIGIPLSANPSDGNTFTADGVVYTWKNTPITPCPNGGLACDIQIGANLIASLVTAVSDVNANDSAISMQEYAAGGPWNVYDFATQEIGAVNISGSNFPDASTIANLSGTSCISFGNSYIHHAETFNYGIMTNSIAYNIQVNYSQGDSVDLGPSTNVTYRAMKSNNAIYDMSGVHSDGMQTQTGGAYTNSSSQAVWDQNIIIENSDMIIPTDAVLASAAHTTLDKFGIPEAMANLEVSGIQMTWPLNNSIIRNNVFEVSATGIQAASVSNTVFANNTFLRPGTPGSIAGAAIVSTGIKAEFSASLTFPLHNVYVNNLTNGVGAGVTATNPGYCTIPAVSTFAKNLSIPPVYDGVLQGSIQDMGYWCSPSGGNSEMNSQVNVNGCASQGGQAVIVTYPGTECGITVGALTGAGGIMQAYSPNYTANKGILIPSTLNPQPPGYPSAPTGGLVCAGTNVAGVSTTNHDGLPWAGGAGCVGVGAY